MKTGNTVSAPVSTSGSGVTATDPAATSTGINAVSSSASGASPASAFPPSGVSLRAAVAGSTARRGGTGTPADLPAVDARPGADVVAVVVVVDVVDAELVAVVEPVAEPLAAAAASPVESHIIAGGEENTTSPSPSDACIPPAAVPLTCSPSAATENRTLRNADDLAAAGVLTTSTSRNPSGVAVNRRSTPGSTSR